MGTYNELFVEFAGLQNSEDAQQWIVENITVALKRVSSEASDRNVILYGTGFLQKPNVPTSHINLSLEDVNGLMAVMHGIDWSKNLTLILHTSGGVISATQSVVSYLRSKFDDVEVIVPTFAMSAGTMIGLASSKIIMARHSQLGPIDAQMPSTRGHSFSARGIIDQFEAAKEDLDHGGNETVWAPILATQGPSLLTEAKNAIDYSKDIVAEWVSTYMFKGEADAEERGQAIATYFNDTNAHKSHGRRIGFEEAAAQGVKVARLEDNQELQEAVLTAYHVMTIAFEQTTLTKMIWSNRGAGWTKHWTGAIK